MNRTLIINIMKKYAFHHPVSVADQWRIGRAKRRGLTHILRQKSRDSVRVSMAVQFYYFLQRIFNNVTIAQSMRVMNAAGAALIVLAGVGLLYTTGIYRNFTAGTLPVLQAKVTRINGNITITGAGGGISKPVEGTILKSGDSIVAAEGSFVDIQTGDRTITRLSAGTEAVLSLNNEGRAAGFNLKRGAILSTGKHDGKILYMVTTGNCIVTPVGTGFSIKYADRRTVVAVTDGRVNVKLLAEGTGTGVNELVLDAGSRAVVTDRIVTDRITPAETDELKKFVSLYPDNEGSDSRKISRPEKMSKLLRQGRGTLPEIKDAFNRIDVITLFTGQVVRGAIITTGRTYNVLTPEGVVNVHESEIRSIEVQR